MRIRWTRGARDHLYEIAESVAQDRPLAAARLVTRLRDAASKLERNPLSGRVVPEFGDPAIRVFAEFDHRLTQGDREGFLFGGGCHREPEGFRVESSHRLQAGGSQPDVREPRRAWSCTGRNALRGFGGPVEGQERGGARGGA